MNKYCLQESTGDKGRWIVTDTEAGVVCEFQEHRFNATQRYTFLDDVDHPDPDQLAKIPNGIADWLATFHYDLAMGDADKIEPAETRCADGIQIGAYIFPVKMTNRLRIGRQVAFFRKHAGLTLKQLAELSGITSQNITKIENGKYNVSIDVLDKILKHINARIDIFPHKSV